METYYLIDFENVHNDGIANIESMTKEDHVHIFSTQNATNIRQDIFWLNGDIKSHLVPIRKQSLDMHLVSYLGYLLGIHGKDCNYVIISKDKDYDNIVKFWQEEGCFNIMEKEISEQNVNKFHAFVNVYERFKNEENVTLDLTPEERNLYDLFKKYKQASSEGTRKQVNRMARFDVLKHFVLEDDSSDELITSLCDKLS